MARRGDVSNVNIRTRGKISPLPLNLCGLVGKLLYSSYMEWHITHSDLAQVVSLICLSL